ncbi:trans-aconitate 2-methyltransferase [Antricoccus suffuscus]|uniref:Trans-aconitate 2-methyltransferase n=2 Tax=Antricoccus suffuscus TaxID=1629062 RepID=A0A2T1A3F3_9ACTN|nr:trans-aconitate 2-methyltransferase [Antricoccus suffuscus]
MAKFGWDPQQYGRFADHRSRPFFDLVARIDADPGRVIDLGCGSGELTATLADRWPNATVEGVDSSETMLTQAAAGDYPVTFRQADLTTFMPGTSYDVVVSNAAYQWVEGHETILTAIASDLPIDGWLAIQVPGNFDAPSHRIIREVVAEERWATALGPDFALRHDPVLTPDGYGDIFAAEGLAVDTWETTYNQVLPGDDPVLEWVKGTALRPVLDRLSTVDTADFLDDLGTRLRAAYPARPYGTVFPFRRFFAVGHRIRH